MKILVVLAIALIVPAALAQQKDRQQPTSAPQPDANGAIYVDHTKVDADFAKGGGIIPRTPQGVTVMAGRHDTPGGVEVHTLDTDIFYIIEGSATFLTGGKVVDQKETSPNEIRGKSLDGGTAHQLSKGDVIVIPKGVPHWFKEITGNPVLYFVVKVR